MLNRQTLQIACDDRQGLVAAVSGALLDAGCNILDAQQHRDAATERFHMRLVFEAAEEGVADFREAFQHIASKNSMDWSLRASARKMRVIIMVSKFDHCLGDLLYRARIGELEMDVVAIISNHPRERLNISLIEKIPFFHLPISKDTKPEQEAQVLALIEEYEADLVVLARYMQILSDQMVSALTGRCINIHHSFLPGFKGAKPYHQAHQRGVKMIGATAHYATADLDEGPIIAQDVEHISHADTPEDLVRKGRNIEQRVLAKAVRLHLQGRVFVDGNKTIVFQD